MLKRQNDDSTGLSMYTWTFKYTGNIWMLMFFGLYRNVMIHIKFGRTFDVYLWVILSNMVVVYSE